MDIFYTVIKNLSKENKNNLHHKTGRNLVEYAAINRYGISNPEIVICKSKPRFKYSKKEFNISHSENIVVAAFDDNPVGIDIEYIKPRDIQSIAKRMQFDLQENSLEEFYKFWTIYEAKYKLGCDTKYCRSQVFLNCYMLSIASKSNIKDINIEEIELSE